MSHREGTGQTLMLVKIQSKGTSETPRGRLSKQVAGTVGIATADTPLERRTAQQRIHDAASATKWDISLSYARVYLQKRSTKFSKLRMTLASHLWEGLLHPLVQILPRQNQQQTLKSVGPTLDGMSNSRFKTKTR